MIVRAEVTGSVLGTAGQIRATCVLPELQAAASTSLRGLLCRNLYAQAHNTYPPLVGHLDIRIAQDTGYIIADSSGIGFDTTIPGQRDPRASLVRDKDGKIGGNQ